MNLYVYLLQTWLYLALFIGCYYLLLRRTTFLPLNRAYLLASLGLAMVLPLVSWPQAAPTPVPVSFQLATYSLRQTPTPTATDGSWLYVGLYGLAVAAGLVWLAVRLRAVFRLIGRGTATRCDGYTLVALPDDSSPSFSFGRYLVLNRTDAATRPDALLRHEQAHIRLGHTVDILTVELLQIALLCPIGWVYKRALQEVHEFQADRAAVAYTSETDYARQLVAYALHVPADTLLTPFSKKSILNQRITMLYKPTSARRALLGYALVLPLAALLVMCTQSEKDPIGDSGIMGRETPTKTAQDMNRIFTVVEQQPEFPGGVSALTDYLSKNLTYPKTALKANAEGKVFVSFVITQTGDIANVQVLKGLGFGLDEAAVRVIKNMPRWKPARQNGEPVSMTYQLPIAFQLEEKNITVIPPPPVEMKDLPKHWYIDGKEVSEVEAKAVKPEDMQSIDVDKKTKSLRITTKGSIPPPPPPPPVDAINPNKPANVTVRGNNGDMQNAKIYLNGKEITKQEMDALAPNTIQTVDVNKSGQTPTIRITTKN